MCQILHCSLDHVNLSISMIRRSRKLLGLFKVLFNRFQFLLQMCDLCVIIIQDLGELAKWLQGRLNAVRSEGADKPSLQFS